MRGVLERHHEQKAVFLVSAGVISDFSANGGNPTGEVAVDKIPLVLHHFGNKFVLLVGADAPVIIDPPVRREVELAVVGKKIVTIDVAAADGEAKVSSGHEADVRIELRKALILNWRL